MDIVISAGKKRFGYRNHVGRAVIPVVWIGMLLFVGFLIDQLISSKEFKWSYLAVLVGFLLVMTFLLGFVWLHIINSGIVIDNDSICTVDWLNRTKKKFFFSEISKVGHDVRDEGLIVGEVWRNTEVIRWTSIIEGFGEIVGEIHVKTGMNVLDRKV